MRGDVIRAAVVSDTHGLLRPEVEQVIGTCDVVIHAGDFDHQMLYHKLAVKQPLYAVRGNNDGSWAANLPLVKRFELGGVKFIMAHERSDIPMALGGEQVVVFGHSHMACQEMEDGRLWLNPGSCGHKRFTLPLSLVVMTIQDQTVKTETVWLDGGPGKASGLKQPDGQVGGSLEIQFGKSSRIGPGKGLETGLEKFPEGKPAGIQAAQPEKSRIQKSGRDELFLIARIMRLMKRGESISWVARNVKSDPGFVETVYRICLTHPGVNAHQILDKLEVNRLYSRD